MKIKHFFFLLSLVGALDVLKSDTCTCSKITSIADCKASVGCKWDDVNKACTSGDSPTSPGETNEGFCAMFTDAPSCAKTRGCAYIEGSCHPFAGCTAYLGASDADCQAISKFCNSDGQFCVDPAACSTYKTQTECTQKASSSGSGTCVWESTCRDQKCTEAPETYITDNECKGFISTCVTTGKGCWTAPLPPCSTYSGDVTACLNLRGSDGRCEGTEAGTKCLARDCKNAPGDTNTNEACAAYQDGCITDGKGCVKTLALCSSYTTKGSIEFCDGLKGSDGACEFDTGTKCKLKSCESASTALSTDAECNSYRAGCFTTGKGCITTRAACSSYKGTTETCKGYIGSDGNCKGTNDTTASSCTPFLCADASASLNTDSDCNNFQRGCRTTGKGCTSTLNACNTYTGDQTSCEGYIGSDGRCKGGSSTGPCSPKVCTEAAKTLTTNKQCDDYQIGCVTTEGGGCIVAGTCTALWKEVSCSGKSSCQWNKLCVANATCASFTTQGVCNENITQNKEKCFWDSTASPSCRLRQCSDAPSTHNTNDLCDAWLKDCWTKGTGCLPRTAVCSEYKGTKATCETFSRKCTNSAGATETATCSEVNCTDNTTATTDSDCETFKPICVTKGTGCIEKTKSCAEYTGTQEICNKVKGTSGQFPCWFVATTGSGPCVEKACTHAPTTVTNDTECNTFLEGCLFKGTGLGCISKTQACSSYSGLAAVCLNFVGNSKKCAKSDVCADRVCADKTSAADQAECSAYKPTCRFFKGKCVDQNTCPNYTHTSALSQQDCQDVLDSATPPNKCWWTSGNSCKARACADSPNKASDAECIGFLTGCFKVKDVGGANVCTEPKACNQYYGTPDECKTYKNTTGTLCWSIASGTANVQCSDRSCALITDLTTESNCTGHLSTCVVNRPGGGNTCITKPANCSGYTGTQDQCRAFEASTDGKCWSVTAGAAACIARTCAQITSPAADTDCSNHLAKCLRAKLNSGASYTCEDSTARTCSNYYGSTAECANLQGSDGKCWLGTGPAACVLKQCSNITPTQDSDCTSHIDTCRMTFASAGSSTKNCISVPTSCTSYFDAPDGCKTKKAINGGADVPCWSTASGTTVVGCINRTCAHLTTPTTDQDCISHMSNCRITNPSGGAACLDKNTNACSAFQGTPSQCQGYAGSDGKCWNVSTSTTAAACKLRVCTDNTTATTDLECSEFLTGCKTNGSGCVASGTACASLNATSTACNNLLSSTANTYCKAGTAASGTCKERACTDNGDATTDAACNDFLKDCVTNGKGCVPKTTPCKYFFGTQAQCAGFTGNGKKCYSTDAVNAGPCIDKVCEHNTTATSDQSCGEFLAGCLTKGTGCLDPTKACDQYAGIQSTCEKFKGASGTITCTNDASATATSKCKDKDCTKNLEALTDAECLTYGIQCVFKGGKGCVKKGPCSQFKGNFESCALFTASDGPCKGTVSATKPDAACTPRVCSEAPNKYITDEECKTYHPTCVTTGYGCASSVDCRDIQGEAACGLKTGCKWTGQCRTLETDCNTYTSSGATVCTNAKVSTGFGTCTWKNNACVATTCGDLPTTIESDDGCKAISSTCTYKGIGCIVKAACKDYEQEAICKTAKSTDPIGSCAWDAKNPNDATAPVGCRPKGCKDADPKLTTNEQCDAYIKGCKTNGAGCVPSTFACSDIKTKVVCHADGSGFPCIWLKDKCYSYKQCTDISFQSNSDCNLITDLCLSDDLKCIPQTKCSLYTKQNSCIKGTDGSCGWTPAKKCQLFTSCNDVLATTNDVCKAYNAKCITDGKNCVEKSNCADYTTEVACNNGGNDGVCQWDKTATSCRLKECSDATTNNKTQSGCAAFVAKEKCTTDGTGCIPEAKCETYKTQAGCVKGTDGDCVWNATAKTCKVKDCTDVKSTKSADCVKALPNCVSNGTNCIAKGECATYTTKESCSNGGGTDGDCAFTPTSAAAVTGTCKKMSACSDANSDQVACSKRSDACRWTAATSTTTSSCTPHTCESVAKGTTCNPVPKFDGKSFSVCSLQGGKCVDGDPGALTQADCFRLSVSTYTWDTKNSKCSACGSGAAAGGGTNTGGGSGTPSNNTTTSTNGYLLNTITLCLLLSLLE